MSVLIYLLKVNLVLTVFYAFYWVFLRRNTFFQANRFYLLGSVLVSFLMPFIKVRHNYTFTEPLPQTLNELPTESIKSVVYQPVLAEARSFTFQWMDVLSVIYLVGVVFFSVRFIIALVRVYALLRESEPIGKPETRSGKDYWLLRTNKAFSSYSFFNFLILNKDDIFYNRGIITDHEEVHISQGHSWDIFFIEIAHIFCWINPLLIHYKDSLRKLHEFLADNIVEGNEKVPYAQFLFEYNFRMNASSLGNDFFRDSLLKERIQMMMKKRSSFWMIGTYAFVIPLAVCMSYFVVAQDVRRVRDAELIPAEFTGGINAFQTYFASNFAYPEGKQLEGEVYASFTVSKEGKVANVMLDKGIRADYNGRVAAVLMSMPDWIPAVKRKQLVESRVFMRITLGKPYGVIASLSNEDLAFRGVIVIDNEVKNYEQKLYYEDYANILKQYEKNKGQLPTYVKLIGQNDDLIDKYNLQAVNGVDYWMYEKQMLVVYNGKEMTDIKGGATSLRVDDSSVEVLSPEMATAKYGEKARHGALVINNKY